MASRPVLSCESTLATQACADVSSFRDPSHSKASSPSTSTLESPSIYVTFKLVQLVNAFRKKVTRKHIAQATTKKLSSQKITTEDFCQDFERRAFEEIDRYLGRKPRERKGSKSRKAAVTAKDKPAKASIDKLLQQLDQSVKFGDDSTQAIANNNRLFLKQQSALSIPRLSVKELCEILVVVKDLLICLQNCSEGRTLDHLSIDESYAGNLLHLLLHIQGELLRLLVARLVELVHQHVSDCQKDQSKRSKEWFFEFPNARHPLSTTWPWSIKPSLAVIWGVCWQFYDHFAPPQFDPEGNLLNDKGEIEVPASVVHAYLSQTQSTTQTQQQPQMQATASRQAYPMSHQPQSNPSFPMATQPPQARQAARTSLSHSPHHHPAHHTARTPDQAPHTTSGLAFAHTNTLLAYTTQPQSTYAQDSAWPLPQVTNLDFSTVYDPAPAVEQAWNQGIPVSYPAPHSQQAHSHFHQTRPIGPTAPLPPRNSRHPSTPAIITTDLSPFPQQQPEDFSNSYSATSVSTNSSIPLREVTSLPTFRNPQYHPGHLSPHSPYMADTLSEARDMQTTTPPHSPHDMAMAEQMTRKRSHSQISNGLPFPQAGGSHHGSQLGEEEFEPESGRAPVHRPEPLMNEHRKYMCNFGGEECEQLTFDRKCEWSKHMDKHDRPYRCQDPGCAKLQGFTYSGGLLRHEREVHGKHGGPKAQLMCPFPECKRHTGKGFTRKENLNEHVRRVHQNREQPPQPQAVLTKQETDFEALAGATRAMDESAETPASRVSEAVMVEEDLQPPASKRRRQVQHSASNPTASEDVEDLRREIEHLQQENAHKDQRLLEMERTVAEMDRRWQEQVVQQRAQNELFEQQQTAATAAAAMAATQQA